MDWQIAFLLKYQLSAQTQAFFAAIFSIRSGIEVAASAQTAMPILIKVFSFLPGKWLRKTDLMVYKKRCCLIASAGLIDALACVGAAIANGFFGVSLALFVGQ